jgi:hypothetical protein
MNNIYCSRLRNDQKSVVFNCTIFMSLSVSFGLYYEVSSLFLIYCIFEKNKMCYQNMHGFYIRSSTFSSATAQLGPGPPHSGGF